MLDHTTTHGRAPVAWGPLVIGILFAGAAAALLVEDAWHRGLSVHHTLQPVLVFGAAAAGIFAHHSFANWRLGYGSAFLLVAAAGSLLVVYGTMGRQADAREARQSMTRAVNAAHADTKAELEMAKKARTKECRTGFKGKCQAWQNRVDALSQKLLGQVVGVLDPRAEALGDLATLVGLDRKRAVALIVAVDPIALPMWLELGSIVFLGAAFPPARRKWRLWSRKGEQIPSVAGECEECVRIITPSEPVSYTRMEALEDLRDMHSVPSQKVLASRWGITEGTVSKWLAVWENDGLVARGARFRKERATLVLPAPR